MSRGAIVFFLLLDGNNGDDVAHGNRTTTSNSFFPPKLSPFDRFLRTAATAVETAQAKTAAQGVEVR